MLVNKRFYHTYEFHLVLATTVYSSGWQSNYSFSCFWHADWPAQVVASNPWICPVRLGQLQNVKLPLGYGGESPYIFDSVNFYLARLSEPSQPSSFHFFYYIFNGNVSPLFYHSLNGRVLPLFYLTFLAVNRRFMEPKRFELLTWQCKCHILPIKLRPLNNIPNRIRTYKVNQRWFDFYRFVKSDLTPHNGITTNTSTLSLY